MKKILFLCITSSLFFCSNIVPYCKDSQGDADYDWAITIKNGYFYPRDKTLRKIFNRCGRKGGYWFEGAARYNIWKKMDIEASCSYFGKEGKALCGTECTKVKIPTLGLGLKYFFNCGDCCNCCCDCPDFLDKLSFFIGGGLRIFFYREHNASCFVKQCFKKTTAGGMVNIGCECDIRKGFFIQVFFDYNFKKLWAYCDNLCCNDSCCNDFCCQGYPKTCCPSYFCNVDLGGSVVGIGLGYKF
ncbi:hypothetical protein ACFLYA_01900 [Candidatus Dependentiae bacterium]